MNSLEAKELSENFKTLSSKKDEISLFAYYLKADSLLLLKWYEEDLSFTETKKKENLLASFSFSEIENGKMVFILVELDTNRKASELDRVFLSNIRLLNEIQANKTALQLILGDDDLLDLKVINLKNLSPRDNYEINFSGVHLFDEYEYILHGKFE